MTSSANIRVQSAYSIDKKIDDGYPQTGNVVAKYLNVSVAFAPVSAGPDSGYPDYGPTTSATPGSATTCYDNGNVGSAVQHYSLAQNGGAGANCALSFRFQ